MATKWNPVLESHQPLRFCRPPPVLLGQRDVEFSMDKTFTNSFNKNNLTLLAVLFTGK